MAITTEQVLEMVKQLTLAAGQQMERMEKNDKTVKDYILKIDEKMKADQARSGGEGGEAIGGGKGGGKGRMRKDSEERHSICSRFSQVANRNGTSGRRT